MEITSAALKSHSTPVLSPMQSTERQK